MLEVLNSLKNCYNTNRKCVHLILRQLQIIFLLNALHEEDAKYLSVVHSVQPEERTQIMKA